MMDSEVTVGIVGGRGYAGRELLRLVGSHPRTGLAYVASRSRAGSPIREVVADWAGDQVFIDASPDAIADRSADVVVLALPNGLSEDYLGAVGPDAVVIDLSADHRLDDGWVYGLPELHRGDLAGATRIANPGCYATAALLALVPIASLLEGEPSVFGVSGYSGAGVDPSPKNDSALLRDNVMPYHLAGHVHERELTHQLGRRVRFAPSVAPFERGLVVTVLAELRQPTDVGTLAQMYANRFAEDGLITVQEEVPLPRAAALREGAIVGGFAVDPVDPCYIGLAVALDNLLKGASAQAMQNLNLACGLKDLEGLQPAG